MLRWAVHLKEGPRRDYHHAPVAVGHQVFSFGGNFPREAAVRERMEVHVFNTVSLRWTKVPPPPPAETPALSGHAPSVRHGHTAVLIGDVVYVWGGFSYMGEGEEEDGNALYGFAVDAPHRWSRPRVHRGAAPGVRRDHSACALRAVMYVHGGFNWTTGCSNDIHRLDTALPAMAWSRVDARGAPAPVLSCHSATIIGTKMFVFGGRDDDNDVGVFDTEADRWLTSTVASRSSSSSSSPSSSSSSSSSTSSSSSSPSVPRGAEERVVPEGRKSHSAFAYGGELYIFGGYNFARTFYDLWRFSPETSSWRKVQPKGRGPCWRFGMCCCVVGDRIVLSGLYAPDDDLYILDFRPTLKTLCKLTVTQHGLETSALPHAVRWELAAMTEGHNNRANNMADCKHKKRYKT